MSLIGVSVGDVLMVVGVNQKGPKEHAVTKIGRKYLTLANGQEFAISNGSHRSKDWPHHFTPMTRAEYDRRASWRDLGEQVRLLGDELRRRAPGDLSHADIYAMEVKVREVRMGLGGKS